MAKSIQPFNVMTTVDVLEICGKEIGQVKSPIEYSAYPQTRIFVQRAGYEADSPYIAYCAVRFVKGENGRLHTFVIDTFGIRKEYRGKGAGKKFFEIVKKEIESPKWHYDLALAGLLVGSNEYYVSLQATYDYDSYVEALIQETKFGGTVAILDMNNIFKRLRGACSFWTKMGFSNHKVSLENSLVRPIIVMWYKSQLNPML
jgi:GNAT superfamily N-acetyltransferase